MSDPLEAHYLAGGDVGQVILALIAADKAGIGLDFNRACAIDQDVGPRCGLAEADVARLDPVGAERSSIRAPPPSEPRSGLDLHQLQAAGEIRVGVGADQTPVFLAGLVAEPPRPCPR